VARVFLINPSMDVAAAFGEYRALMEPMPCIGLAYLAGACRAAGHEVRVLDDFVDGLAPEAVVDAARAWRPDVVGLTMLTPTARSTEDLARRLRDGLPGVRVVLGNLHASLFADELLARGACDVVVHGEGEDRFPRLVDALAGRGGFDGIDGISYRDGGRAVHVPQGEPIRDLDAVPRPAWDLFPWRAYTFLPFVTVARPCLSILGTRGCPFRCAFCALGYMGSRVRARSPESIAGEVEWLVRDFGVRHVGFVDPIFPLSKAHGIETCRAIERRRIPGRWWWTSETRVDVIDEETCRAMKAARCKRILFGIESGVDELLRGVGKNFTTADARRAVAVARAAGLEISAFFMLGLPGETAEMTRRTIDFALELDLDFAKFGITVPLPGSALYDQLVEEGKIAAGDWDRFTTFNPDPETLPYVPEGITGAELQALHRRATWRFYVRPRMIWRHLFVVRSIGWRALWNGARLLLTQAFRGRL
jgi:radical SAM superfamily enzyme YgiQ (UPF0313 family)